MSESKKDTEVSKVNDLESNSPKNVIKIRPVRRDTLVVPHIKSIESKLWDLLQPLARLWGLITAVGKLQYN